MEKIRISLTRTIRTRIAIEYVSLLDFRSFPVRKYGKISVLEWICLNIFRTVFGHKKMCFRIKVCEYHTRPENDTTRRPIVTNIAGINKNGKEIKEEKFDDVWDTLHFVYSLWIIRFVFVVGAGIVKRYYAFSFAVGPCVKITVYLFKCIRCVSPSSPQVCATLKNTGSTLHDEQRRYRLQSHAFVRRTL